MIIHITCAPGCGKTSIGKYIKSMYPSVVCKDLDDLYEEFKEQKYKKSYQMYIYNFIKQNSKSKHIIFVGLNWYQFQPNVVFDVKADLKLFMDISDDENIKRRILRQLPLITNSIFKDKTLDEMYEEIMENPDILNKWGHYIQYKLLNLNPDKLRKSIKEYRNFYRKQGYTFIDYSSMLSLLHDILHSTN